MVASPTAKMVALRRRTRVERAPVSRAFPPVLGARSMFMRLHPERSDPRTQAQRILRRGAGRPSVATLLGLEVLLEPEPDAAMHEQRLPESVDPTRPADQVTAVKEVVDR